jgi:hypothetical protein
MFVFESATWQQCFPSDAVFELKVVFRQSDPRLLDLLGEARSGRLSHQSCALLR